MCLPVPRNSSVVLKTREETLCKTKVSLSPVNIFMLVSVDKFTSNNKITDVLLFMKFSSTGQYAVALFKGTLRAMHFPIVIQEFYQQLVRSISIENIRKHLLNLSGETAPTKTGKMHINDTKVFLVELSRKQQFSPYF